MTPDLVSRRSSPARRPGAIGTHFGVIADRPRRRDQNHRRLELRLSLSGIGNPQFKTLTDLNGPKIAGAPSKHTTTIFRRRSCSARCPASATPCFSAVAARRDFKPSRRPRVLASLAEAPPYEFQILEAAEECWSQLLRLYQKHFA